MSDTILVTGVIDFDPAKHDDAVEAATIMMEATHAEEGCVTYTFSADLANPGRFWLQEQWESQEAVDKHSASAHMAEFMGKMGDLGVTNASITVWTGASGRPMM